MHYIFIGGCLLVRCLGFLIVRVDTLYEFLIDDINYEKGDVIRTAYSLGHKSNNTAITKYYFKAYCLLLHKFKAKNISKIIVLRLNKSESLSHDRVELRGEKKSEENRTNLIH